MILVMIQASILCHAPQTTRSDSHQRAGLVKRGNVSAGLGGFLSWALGGGGGGAHGRGYSLVQDLALGASVAKEWSFRGRALRPRITPVKMGPETYSWVS